ncbi:MAG: hypothetical protein IPL46_02560 [Saprospiraceae bacterium]|nr:hypothetical protein [Saprospiraceae bacterium]
MDTFNQENNHKFTRRSFIQKSTLAGTSTLFAANHIFFAGASDTIRVGLIGCGGRGTEAGIIDCAESSKGIQLVAIGDLFQDHLDDAPNAIKRNLEKEIYPSRIFTK